jgi:hypothetical protein
MGWFAPALSAACLFAAAVLPAGVPAAVRAEAAPTNAPLFAALDHMAHQSQLNRFGGPGFTSTNLSGRRSTNALSSGWN